MKRTGLLLSIALVVLVSPFVSAQESFDDTRVELIKQNCAAAQATMQRVLRSDTASRLNRGRAYEETTKLFAAFNSRAAINRYNVPGLVQTSADFAAEFSAFKTTYITYDTSVKEALRIRCQEQPVTFYDALTKVREQRAKLSTHVTKLSEIITAYQNGLSSVSTQISERNGDRP